MARIAGLLMLCLLAASCGRAEPAARSAAETPVVEPAATAEVEAFPYCGGALKPGAAEAYFRRLKAQLDGSDAPVPMTFYDKQIGIMSDGRHLQFNRDDFQPGSRALLSNAEWREILDRGFEDLESIGWRGCMLADGKAAFQSSQDGELVLSTFDKDRVWIPSRRNM